MISSSLLLGLGATFLVAVRVSGNPSGLGFVVFAGLVVVALACALHLSAAISSSALSGPLRAAAIGACWLAIAGGTAWVVVSAPGMELLVVLMVVPPVVGVAGLLARRGGPGRPAAITFLVISLLLTAALAPVLIDRIG